MMKKQTISAIFILLTGILILSGCKGQDTEPIEYMDGWGSVTNQTKTITVEYPPEWNEDVISDVNDDYISFYEKKDYDSGNGGHLFTVMRFNNNDYKELPSYKVIAEDKSKGVTFIIMYPTDVQFTNETAEEYNRLADFTDEIISHIHLKF